MIGRRTLQIWVRFWLRFAHFSTPAYTNLGSFCIFCFFWCPLPPFGVRRPARGELAEPVPALLSAAVAAHAGRGPPLPLHCQRTASISSPLPSGPYVKAEPLGAARRNAVGLPRLRGRGGPFGRAERAQAEPTLRDATTSCPGRNAKPVLYFKEPPTIPPSPPRVQQKLSIQDNSICSRRLCHCRPRPRRGAFRSEWLTSRRSPRLAELLRPSRGPVFAAVAARGECGPVVRPAFVGRAASPRRPRPPSVCRLARLRRGSRPGCRRIDAAFDRRTPTAERHPPTTPSPPPPRPPTLPCDALRARLLSAFTHGSYSPGPNAPSAA